MSLRLYAPEDLNYVSTLPKLSLYTESTDSDSVGNDSYNCDDDCESHGDSFASDRFAGDGFSSRGLDESDLDYGSDSDCSTIISWRIPFRGSYGSSGNRTSYMEIVQRSRLLYSQRRCHECGRPTVSPLVQEDSPKGSNRLPVPGTGTLKGFHCDYCSHEWTA